MPLPKTSTRLDFFSPGVYPRTAIQKDRINLFFPLDHGKATPSLGLDLHDLILNNSNLILAESIS
jgi:hypothetical protein